MATESVACAGETVSVAVLVTPNEAEIVTELVAPTAPVATVNAALVAPSPTVTLAGTHARAALLLASVTTAPPDGAAPVKVTVPCEELPPVTVVGLGDKVDSATEGSGGAGPELTLTRRIEDHAPGAHAELCPRTRHHSVVTGRMLLVNSDATTD